MWDHRKFYTLGEAYWHVGYAIFGKAWTGYETTYGPVAELSDLRLKRKNAQRDFERQLDQAKFLRMHDPENASDAEYRAYREEIRKAEIAAADARGKRDQLSQALRVPEQNQEHFERGVNVQQRLVRAFSHCEISLIFGTGQQVEWKEWAQHTTFRVSFALSLIYAPSDISSQRRATGFIERKTFDDWLTNVLAIEVKLANREGPEQFMKMRDWFLEWIMENPKKPNKDDGERQFLSNFTPKGKTTFADLWKSFAPDHWRQKGRPKS